MPFHVTPAVSPIPSTPPITAMIDPTPSLLVTVVSAVVPLAVLVIGKYLLANSPLEYVNFLLQSLSS